MDKKCLVAYGLTITKNVKQMDQKLKLFLFTDRQYNVYVPHPQKSTKALLELLSELN